MATRTSHPLVMQLQALAARREPAGAQVLLQAAKSLHRLFNTGKYTSRRTAPALARLLTAALDQPAAWMGSKPFTFTHDGHRYRVRTFPNGRTRVSTMGGQDLTLALCPPKRKPSMISTPVRTQQCHVPNTTRSSTAAASRNPPASNTNGTQPGSRLSRPTRPAAQSHSVSVSDTSAPWRRALQPGQLGVAKQQPTQHCRGSAEPHQGGQVGAVRTAHQGDCQAKPEEHASHKEIIE